MIGYKPLFRGWDGKTMHENVNIMDGEAVRRGYGLYRFHGKAAGGIPMQWTGLPDRLGRPIYEDDVVKGHFRANGRSYRLIGLVVFKAPAFVIHGVKQYAGYRQPLDSSYEVIGNRHEHPELVTEARSNAP